MFRRKNRFDRAHEEVTARLREHEAAYPEITALYVAAATELHAETPDPQCYACEVAALDDADRMFLKAHGWIEPQHRPY